MMKKGSVALFDDDVSLDWGYGKEAEEYALEIAFYRSEWVRFLTTMPAEDTPKPFTAFVANAQNLGGAYSV